MENSKKVLVIGAGLYQVPIIKKIKELGHDAFCVDRNSDAVGFDFATAHKVIDVLDKNACLEYAKSNNINAVLTFGATLPLTTVAYIGQQLNLPAISSETAELSTSKYAIKKRLAEHGCNIYGDFFEIKNRNDVINHSFDFPCVIKPCDGSGSKGVSLVYNQESLENAINCAFDAARYGKIYKEGLISGEEYTVESFVDKGKIYIYAIIKTTFSKNGDETVDYGHRTPSGLSKEKEQIISDEIKKAISALKINMASVNFDVILSDDGKPYIIDCGIRIGQNLIASHIIPYSRGVDVTENTIRQALGEELDAAPKYNLCIATRLLIYKPGIISEIKDFSEIIGKNDIVDIVLRKKVGERQSIYREKSDSCGWVITKGKTPDEAESAAKKAKTILEKYIIFDRSCQGENNEI